jgi:hypothetical protein
MNPFGVKKEHSKKLFTAAFILGFTILSNTSAAQLLNNLSTMDLGDVHGNFQANAQYYIPDSTIGAAEVPEKMLFNGFANILYTKGKFTAGIRYESYLNAIQGYPTGFKGTGIPYRFASYKSDFLEITVGSFYEQFGNGLTLRTYEERNLGLDNALDGVRIKAEPLKGVYLKGLVGKQRSGFSQGPGLVRGFDGEIQLNEAFKMFEKKKLVVSIGGSFVSKYQEDRDPTLVLPVNVGNSAGRLRISRNNFSMNGEYAYKINDPSTDNGFNYKSGDAMLLQASYAVKGFALQLSGSRIDNMSFRSDRSAQLTNLLLNYIPALNRQHTYSLLTFYPYASQAKNEMEFSGEVKYKFKKESILGGKYGTEVIVNYSGSNSIDTTHLNPLTDTLRRGYTSNYFGIGKDVYFRDFYVEINKKFNKKWKATLIYAYQVYNKDVIQKPGGGMIFSNIQVLDLTYKFKPESALRLELQNLSTRQDHQDWAYALLEYTVNTNWYIAVGDQYNYGNEHTDQRYHYYNVSAGYIRNANRIELTYGKQREGIFCVGGVCRNVPASNGVTLTITSSF